MSVGLVVNCYERTYREVLSPGFFPGVVNSNNRSFQEVVALINNVDSREDAHERANQLVRDGEISSFSFVSDHIEEALATSSLSKRALRRRPYLLDYGIVMPHVVSTEWLLGWDAETRLTRDVNWVDPSIQFMESDSRIFHCSVDWPPASPEDAGVEGDAVGQVGDFLLSWGFSDQLFLLKRSSLVGKCFSSFSPAAIARHAPHPYTFEFRVESYQRAHRKMRATLSTVAYDTNLSLGGVLGRTGKSRTEDLRRRALHRLEHRVTRNLPSAFGPRFARNSSPQEARW